MDFNFDLNLVQSQKLLLTPQLKQAIEILRMNSQELFEYVEEQLEVNPVLEFGENDDNIGETDYIAEKEHDDENNDEETDGLIVDRPTIMPSLKAHLLFQLHTSNLDESQILIGEYLIDNIDENGYLLIELSEVALYFNVHVRKVRRVLRHIQNFDPPGIGARNLKECLLIQIKQIGNVDVNIIKIVDNYLDDLADNKIIAIAKNTGLEEQKVAEIFDFIKTLEPKPGREYYNNYDIKYTIPDILVKKIKNKYEVLINEESIPLVNINSYYREIEMDEVSNEAKKFIENRIDKATWLIKSIEQRKSTLIKVAESIVDKQMNFFEKGKEFLKPLAVEEVAREVDMHESIVSRAIHGKFLQCIWGTFELRYFFSRED